MASDPSAGYDAGEFVAEFYDQMPAYERPDSVEFYVALARESGGPVLELGCGTGRVLVPTAQAGIGITGLDASDTMLAACRRKVSQEPAEVQSRVELVRGDMRDFDLGQQFRLITTPFRPFQHLVTLEEQMSCLECARRHLADGGRFVLELFNPRLERLVEEKHVEPARDAEFEMPDGRKVERFARTVRRDNFQQVQDVELIYEVTHPDGRRQRLVHAFPMRHLFRFEAEHLLARCGFATEAVYADFDRSAYGSKYPGELIFVARRAA